MVASSKASSAMPAVDPHEIRASGALACPFDRKRSLRCLSGFSLRSRFSFIFAWTEPEAVGAPLSVCSMPDAR